MHVLNALYGPCTLVHTPHNTPNCIYTHTNNQQALKSEYLSSKLDTFNVVGFPPLPFVM